MITTLQEEVSVRCVCGARTTYRITRGATTLYRCAACSSAYTFPLWDAELLPWAKRLVDQAFDVYQHYRELRDRLPDLAPELLATLPRFKDVAPLEERYQRERRRRAS